MADDPETLLFARYRDRADVGALGQLYDATAVELLRVALHLVRDPARAEDLVQQTFVAAIEASPRFDARRPVRAWLLGILANLARKLHREQARVAQAGSEPTADPSAVAAAAEFTAQVDAAIDTLPEVYRPVLVLHLQHGLIAAEIAHALRRPPGTVRTQLMRALELLRQALPASAALGAALLGAPLRGLAAVRELVVADAARHVAAAGVSAGAGAGAAAGVSAGAAGAGAGLGAGAGVAGAGGGVGAGAVGAGARFGARAAAGAASAFSGVVLMKKYVVAAVLVVLALVVGLRWPTPDAAPPDGANANAAAVAARASLPPPPSATAAASAPAPLARDEVAAVTPALGALRYRVLWASDRTPAVGVWAHVVVWNRPNAMAATIDIATDANGEIALGDLEPGQVGVYLDRAEGLSRAIAAGEEDAATILVPRGVDVDVTVQDEQGQPIPNARVWLSHYGNGSQGHEVALTNAAGRTFVRDVGEGRCIAARADGFAPGAIRDVEAKPGDRQDVTLVLAADGAAIRGVVYRPDGSPAAGTRVWIGDFPAERTSDRTAGRTPPPFELTADEQGCFVARGLPSALVSLMARATGTGTAARSVPLQASAITAVELHLPAAAAVGGFVRDEDGRPLADVRVGGGDTYGGFRYCQARTAADGSFTLDGLTEGVAQIHASRRPFLTTRQRVQVLAGRRGALDLVLRRSQPADQIRGVVVDEHGAPRCNWFVSVRGPGQTADVWSAWLRTDAEGRFEATGCRQPGCRIEVFDPDSKPFVYPLLALDGVGPGGEDLRLVVPASALTFGGFVGTVVDAAGQRIVGARVTARTPSATGAPSAKADELGRFHLPRLPAGQFSLELTAPGHASLSLGEREAVAGRDVDLGTIVLPRGGRLAVRCRGAAPADVRWGRGVVWRADGARAAHLELGAEPVESEALAPGDYELLVVGGGIAATRRPFVIRDGETTELELDLQPGAWVQVEVPDTATRAWTTIELTATDAAGACVWRMDLTRRGAEALSFVVSLGAGVWRLDARTDNGLAASAAVAITDVTTAPAPVVLELR